MSFAAVTARLFEKNIAAGMVCSLFIRLCRRGDFALVAEQVFVVFYAFFSQLLMLPLVSACGGCPYCRGSSGQESRCFVEKAGPSCIFMYNRLPLVDIDKAAGNIY